MGIEFLGLGFSTLLAIFAFVVVLIGELISKPRKKILICVIAVAILATGILGYFDNLRHTEALELAADEQKKSGKQIAKLTDSASTLKEGNDKILDSAGRSEEELSFARERIKNLQAMSSRLQSDFALSRRENSDLHTTVVQLRQQILELQITADKNAADRRIAEANLQMAEKRQADAARLNSLIAYCKSLYSRTERVSRGPFGNESRSTSITNRPADRKIIGKGRCMNGTYIPPAN
ncbi:MAG: hypothetical protein AAGE37_08640 [Pseudomonadota bacterium]